MYHKYLQLNHLQFGQFLTKFIVFMKNMRMLCWVEQWLFIFNFYFLLVINVSSILFKKLHFNFPATFLIIGGFRFWEVISFIICHQPGTQKFCHILTFRLENRTIIFIPKTYLKNVSFFHVMIQIAFMLIACTAQMQRLPCLIVPLTDWLCNLLKLNISWREKKPSWYFRVSVSQSWTFSTFCLIVPFFVRPWVSAFESRWKGREREKKRRRWRRDIKQRRRNGRKEEEVAKNKEKIILRPKEILITCGHFQNLVV